MCLCVCVYFIVKVFNIENKGKIFNVRRVKEDFIRFYFFD